MNTAAPDSNSHRWVSISSSIAAGLKPSSYSYHLIESLSLPIPRGLALLTILLPVISVLSTYGAGRLVKFNINGHPTITLPPLLILFLQLVYESIIATYFLTTVADSSTTDCRLDRQWQSFFSAHNADAIGGIERTLQCCGLNSVVDRPWPFPNKDHGVRACADALGYTKSCWADWRRAQRGSAGAFFGVAVVVFVIKVRVSCTRLLPSNMPGRLLHESGHLES